LYASIACGANAVSKRIFPSENRIERIGAPKDVKTYIEKLDKLLEEKEKLFKL
jgi:oxygen-independent coproporphyrinogen-3 oxidase